MFRIESDFGPICIVDEDGRIVADSLLTMEDAQRELERLLKTESDSTETHPGNR